MKTKTFDCIELKRRAALRIYERTRDLDIDRKIEYWRARSAEFRDEQERLNPKTNTQDQK